MAYPGFSGLQRLHEGGQSIVFRAVREADRRPVLLKVLRGPAPSRASLARFRQEFDLLNQLAGPGIARCESWLDTGSEPAIVFEDSKGIPLDQVLDDGPIPVEDAFNIARSAAEALARVHALGIVHRDIKPANLIWDRGLRQLDLIDFGLSTRIRRTHVEARPVERLEGTLAYLAPEQSGRMNRPLDERADLYSLGATLYHTLTGRPPFVHADPREVLHGHLARTPTSILDLRPETPATLNAIVMRLLAKNADDRYQSASGLLHDLERAHGLWLDGSTSTFELGARDRPLRLTVPASLYGREAELDLLRGAFDRARRGRVEIVFVDGFAGIGKTRLVRELERHVTTGGRFLMGKFEQFSRAVPYSAVQRAVAAFLRGVLTSDEYVLREWRRRIGDAVGSLGGLLASEVPELAVLLQTSFAPVDELPPAEAETRFDLLMRRLLRSLTSAMEPVVLFLDDLQWADLASLRLVERLASDPDARHLLLIGAWRDHEVGDGHPLRITLGALEAGDLPIEWVHLRPLHENDVQRMVADTFGEPGDDVRELAQLLHQRTGGNALFVHRFLVALDELGLLTPTDRGWRCDAEALRSAQLPADLVSFLGVRMETLGADTRHALAVAAQFADDVPLRALAQVLGLTPTEAASRLAPAIDQGLLVRTDDASFDEYDLTQLDDTSLSDDASPVYRFAHDRIEEAAAMLLSNDERASWHLVLAEFTESERVGAGFRVVEHYLVAEPLLVEPEQRLHVAQRALTVATAAIQSAAFEPARRYASLGLRLCGPRGWESHPDLVQPLTLRAAEADYLTAHMESAQRRVAELVARATTPLDALRAHEIGVMALVSQNRLVEAVERAIDVLRIVDIQLPAEPGQLDLVKGLLTTRTALLGRTAEDLLGLPRCEDETLQQGMRILVGIMGAAYYARPLLLPLLAFTLVRTSIRRGLFDETPFGVCVWGLVLCTIGDIERGVSYGRVSLRLNELVAPRRLRYRTEHLFHTHLRMWVEPWRQCRQALRMIHQGCYEGGDVEYAAFSAFMAGALGVYTGEALDELSSDMHARAEAIRSLGQDTSLHTLRMHQQLVLNLLGRAERHDELEGEAYSARRDGDAHRAANDETNLYCAALTQGWLAWLLGDAARASSFVVETSKYPSGAGSTLFIPLTAYLDALAHLDLATRVGGVRRAAWVVRARRATSRIERWARHGPENLGHRLHLVRAEWARLLGRTSDALHHYAQAIQEGERGGWWMDVAMAYERLGRFHLDAGRRAFARSHLLEARTRYDRWGAHAVVARFDREFASVLAGSAGPTSTTHAETRRAADVSHASGESQVDLGALLTASQSIAQEVNLRDLLRTLVVLSVESAGATRGALLTWEERDLHLAWEAVSTEAVETRERQIPLDAWHDGPRSVLRYLIRTQQTILVDDVESSELFADDPWFREGRARTALAIPIVQQGRLVAALYLEHDASARAFAPARQQLLSALAGQAAIAIENARMVEQLESKVRQRTAQLLETRRQVEAERDRADQLLFNILPRTIAQELKDTGHSRPFNVPESTVLFTDFKGFTPLASQMTPEQVVAELDACFLVFDEIVDRWGVEKLKTIGDGYMAAAGVPHPSRHHALQCVLASLQMLAFMRQPGPHGVERLFNVRIGLHSGPVVAGVIGQRRLAFDIWGDTVNTASRMESSCEPGRLNVSRATWELVEPWVYGESRGAVEAKGKGSMEMFYVDGVRDDLLPTDEWRDLWRHTGFDLR